MLALVPVAEAAAVDDVLVAEDDEELELELAEALEAVPEVEIVFEA